MDKIVVDNVSTGGLGTTLMLISTFVNLNKPVVWRISNPLNNEKDFVNSIKKIFGIPDSSLQFEFDNSSTPRVQWSDYIKFFSKYIAADQINIGNSNYYVDEKKPKRCVAISMYDGKTSNSAFNYDQFEFKKTQWPTKKMWPLDINLQLISLILRSDYDVISLDQYNIPLEEKTYILNNCCDAVIGYEGGLQHLAHILKIPCIILPWSSNEQSAIITHSTHLDQKTWLIDNTVILSKLLSFTPDQFRSKINDLKNNLGNNIWLNNQPIQMGENFEIKMGNFGLSNLDFVPPLEKEFWLKHLPEFKIGGIVPVDTN
jgi:hypothetical protein